MSNDVYDIGWWIESTDETVYGPASRDTLARFLRTGIISTNTLVRHCTQVEFRPVADQPGIAKALEQATEVRATGDQLANAWPGRRRDALPLAEAALPCARHNRLAVLVCASCQAPYCEKCRARPRRRQFFRCRKCQANAYNRRGFAYVFDSMILTLPVYVPAIMLGGTQRTASAMGTVFGFLFVVVGFAFYFRDPLFGGASPGKRIVGLRVVSARDGVTPVTYVQALVRNVSLLIPFFNLVDLTVPYRDPLCRRYGDRWAKTLVVDAVHKLEARRMKVRRWLAQKGVELEPFPDVTPEQLARTAG